MQPVETEPPQIIITLSPGQLVLVILGMITITLFTAGFSAYAIHSYTHLPRSHPHLRHAEVLRIYYFTPLIICNTSSLLTRLRAFTSSSTSFFTMSSIIFLLS